MKVSARSLGVTIAVWAVTPAALAAESPADRLSNQRIIKTIDFDEPENYEPIPMHWERLVRFAFPDFATAGFDESVGATGPPSFRLDASGANIAFSYRGQDIPVKPGSDYEIHARVRTSGMDHARAYFSAFYADRHGRVLPGSEVFSELVGSNASSDWVDVSLTLVGEFPSARAIGLTVWVTQDSVWSRGPVSPRRIEHVDVDAVAWFDDIVVHRLPRTAIRAAVGTPLFALGEPVLLDVLVCDPDGLNASAELAISDADGNSVWRRAVRIRTAANPEPERIAIGSLGVGVYTATLNITTHEKVLSSESYGFAVIGDLSDGGGRPENGRLGIVLDEAPRGRWLANQGILRQLAVQHAKIPVRGDDWTTPAATTQDETFDQLLGWMARNRMHVIAELRTPTFLTTPRERRIDRPLFDVLSEDASTWLPYVSYLLSRYADMVTAWQIGQDGDAGPVWDNRLPEFLPGVRSQFASFVFNPILVTTWSLEHALPPTRAFGDAVSIRVPNGIAPAWIAGYWSSLPAAASDRYWAYVEPLPSGLYARRTRLADFAERLVELLKLDVAVIYVRQPWIWEKRHEHPTPVEELLVLRAVASMLSAARWAGTMQLDGRTSAEIFDRGELGVLVVQDKSAAAQSRVVETYLGDDVRVYDLLGREMPVEISGGNVKLPVGAEPVFVTGVPTWQMRLRGGVGLDDPRIDTAPGIQSRKIQFTNVSEAPIGGVLHLTVPRYWEVKPVYLPFNLQPGETFERELRIRVPNNESAGRKSMVARMSLETGGHGTFEIPIRIELGMRDVDVTTFAMMRDTSVVVRQIVTNRSAAPLSFAGFVAAPGRPRISRVIPNIQPGQTLAKDYTLPGAEDLVGQSIRVGLREIRGDRQYSQSVIVP